MIYVAEGINLKRMADDQEFTHYRLAHIIDVLENGSDFLRAKQVGQMLAEIQTAHHEEYHFKDWMHDVLRSKFMEFSEADKELCLVTKDQLCVRPPRCIPTTVVVLKPGHKPEVKEW